MIAEIRLAFALVPRSVRSPILIMCVATTLAGTEIAAQQTYRRAEIDSNGQLRIITSSRREIAPRKDGDQLSFDKVAISADHQSVGWLALYPNCCTSYPIPLKLVVLTRGTERTFTGNGLPVWEWSFSSDGKRVALRQAPVHGVAGLHFELRDIQSGRRMRSFDPESDNSRGMPAWIRVLKHPN
jgi:hypothetical protein